MLTRFVRLRFAPRVAAALLAATAASYACGTAAPALPPVGLMEPDQWLFDRGNEMLEAEKWSAAREYFQRLVDGYPQSAHREDAKLGVGDGYIGEDSLESNILAINEFREFLTFFPVSPRADYAQYRIVLAYSRQMLSPQRDQTATRDTLREVEIFFQRYPNSPHRPEVEALQREARDRLSESEYQIGYFYARFNVCAGAVARFRNILVTDPEFSRRDRVYFQMAECLLKMGSPAEALPWYERLVAEFKESEHLEKTKQRIEEIKGGIQDSGAGGKRR